MFYQKDTEKNPENNNSVEDPLKKSKNLELAPLKTSKENNSLVPEHPSQAQGSTMWKKKPQNDSKVAAGDSTSLKSEHPFFSMIKRYRVLKKLKIKSYKDFRQNFQFFWMIITL